MKKWKWLENVKKIPASELFNLLLSIAIGVLVYSTKDFLHHEAVLESALAGCITYIAGCMLKNPYGKLEKKISEYSQKDDTVFEKMDSQITELQALLDKIRGERAKISDIVLYDLIKYLAEETYNNCSGQDNHCQACPHYAEHCGGLLRAYLREDSEKLAESIKKVEKEHSYMLNNDISYYHTLAIERLISMEGTSYRVIQTLMGGEKEAYDQMDVDFMHIFLQKIKENDYAKKKNFKVKWIFVGDNTESNARRNYYYLIEELLQTENKEIKEIFEFRTMSRTAYNQAFSSFKKIGNTSINKYFHSDPSLGIFDRDFVFVDADENEDDHGTMYANQEDIANLISFYDWLWDSQDIRQTTLQKLADLVKLS